MVKTLVSKVRWHFLSKGYKEVRGKGSGKELLFEDGLHLTLVRILAKEDLSDRNAILRTIVSLNPREAKVNRAYLALPKRYVAALDGSILREMGIGIIAYDEGGVQEVMSAALFEKELESQRLEEAETLRYDIDELRRLYTELRREVSDLGEELAELRREVRSLKAENSTAKAMGMRKAEPVVVKGSVAEGRELPSFFADNPWLDVLSRRGKEDVAGGRADE